MTIVTTTTRLLDVLTFSRSFPCDSLTVCHLRLADIRLDSKLALHTIDNNLKMEFSHSCDNSLVCFWVSTHSESRIFLRKTVERHAHLLLVGLGLWLNTKRDNWFWENDTVELNRVLFVTHRVRSYRIFESDCGSDLTCIHLLDLFTIIGMHAEDATDTLFVASTRIVNIWSGRKRTWVDTEEYDLSNERIGRDLKCKRWEWLTIWCMSLCFFIGIWIDSSNSWDIKWWRQVINNRIEHKLDTLVLQCWACKYWKNAICNDCFTHQRLQSFKVWDFTLKILTHDSIVLFDDLLNQLIVILLGICHQILGNVFLDNLVPHLAFEIECFHLE